MNPSRVDLPRLLRSTRAEKTHQLRERRTPLNLAKSRKILRATYHICRFPDSIGVTTGGCPCGHLLAGFRRRERLLTDDLQAGGDHTFDTYLSSQSNVLYQPRVPVCFGPASVNLLVSCSCVANTRLISTLNKEVRKPVACAIQPRPVPPRVPRLLSMHVRMALVTGCRDRAFRMPRQSVPFHLLARSRGTRSV